MRYGSCVSPAEDCHGNESGQRRLSRRARREAPPATLRQTRHFFQFALRELLLLFALVAVLLGLVAQRFTRALNRGEFRRRPAGRRPRKLTWTRQFERMTSRWPGRLEAAPLKLSLRRRTVRHCCLLASQTARSKSWNCFSITRRKQSDSSNWAIRPRCFPPDARARCQPH